MIICTTYPASGSNEILETETFDSESAMLAELQASSTEEYVAAVMEQWEVSQTATVQNGSTIDYYSLTS